MYSNLQLGHQFKSFVMTYKDYNLTENVANLRLNKQMLFTDNLNISCF